MKLGPGELGLGGCSRGLGSGVLGLVKLESGGMKSEELKWGGWGRGVESGGWGQRSCGWGMGSEELGGLGSGVLRSVKLGPGELGLGG